MGKGGDLSKVMRAQFGYGNVAKVYVTQLPNNNKKKQNEQARIDTNHLICAAKKQGLDRAKRVARKCNKKNEQTGSRIRTIRSQNA